MMGMEFGLVMKIMIQWLMKSIGQNPLNSMPMVHGIIMALKQSSEWDCLSTIWGMECS